MEEPREQQPMGLSPEQVQLLPFYHDLRNEIVEPDRVVVSTQYFWTRWAPLLGPTLTALVVTLRRHCYYNKVTKERRDWCFPEQATLAREIGVDSTKTIRAALAHPLARHFIRREARYVYDPERRKKIRTSDMYYVAMDDPLTPEDERLLCIRAAERLLAEGRSAESVASTTSPIDLPGGNPLRESAPGLDAVDDAGGGDTTTTTISQSLSRSLSHSQNNAVPPRRSRSARARPDGSFYPQVEGSEGEIFPQDSSVNSAPEVLLLNSTFYTTTTTTNVSPNAAETARLQPRKAVPPGHSGAEASRTAALDAYASANNRPATSAEMQQLAELAARYTSAAYHQGATGWGWLHDAIAEAVAAGSAFVAPRRIDRILHRWATEGRAASDTPSSAPRSAPPPSRGRRPPASAPRPQEQTAPPSAKASDEPDATEPSAALSLETEGGASGPAHLGPSPDAETTAGTHAGRTHRTKMKRPRFVVDPATGLTNVQCWALVLDNLSRIVSPAAFHAWLKPTALLARADDGVLVVGAPSSTHAAWLEDRLRADIETAVRHVLGRPSALQFVAEPAWRAAQA